MVSTSSTAGAGLLRDKVIVLSGVGPGLGRSLGEEAARMGADLVLASRTQKRLDKMAEVVRSHGRREVQGRTWIPGRWFDPPTGWV